MIDDKDREAAIDAARRPDPRSAAFATAFGARLAAAGLIDEAGAQRARRAASVTRERFDHVLTKLGLLSEQDLTAQLAAHLGLSVFAASDAPIEPVSTEDVDQAFLHRQRVALLGLDDRCLTLAVCDPFDADSPRALGYLLDRPVELRLITPADYDRLAASLSGGEQRVTLGEREDRWDLGANEHDLQRLRDLANEAPVIRLVNQIIAKAVEVGASDIHFEPQSDMTAVRYRVDGVLRVAQTIAFAQQAAVASRVKIMAKLDIAERRLPQDGRVKIGVRGVDVDFRVSTIPTAFGESVVMRILDRRAVTLDFAKLGFQPPVVAGLRRLLAQPNGIVLVTGPTGSGKTTTLYAALKEIHRPGVKLFTVEDPIEHQLEGVNQVQVHDAVGLDFPAALRSILRQDPDIVMIGEIRDATTAKIAIQASLTGHLVLSTLHTNSAAASVARLIDMGAETYLLASTLKGVLAQRLVRRLCPHCSRPDEEAASWGERTPDACRSGPMNFRKAYGCERCEGTGYRGRTTIAELLLLDRPIQDLIHARAPDAEIERRARADGMRLLFEDGLAKAWRGETSLAEIFSVARADP